MLFVFIYRVNPWESEQQDKWTPTVQVLQHLQKQLSSCQEITSPAASLKLLCGADLLETFAVPNLWPEKDVRYVLTSSGTRTSVAGVLSS